MPKTQNPKLAIHLDLLKPQSNPEQVFVKLIHWLLSIGRYIFIFVEAVVLIAFAARFKLDSDLYDKKVAIETQLPYIEGLKPIEDLIKRTQLKLSTIDSAQKTYTDYPQILKGIADQTPAGIKLSLLTVEKKDAKTSFSLTGQAQNNNDVAAFFNGLKTSKLFTDVVITNISLEKNMMDFSVSANVDLSHLGGANL